MGADVVLPPLGAADIADGDAVVCYPYGVGHGDEGISLGLSIGPYRVLLDCGLEDLAPLENEPPPNAVFYSHAHGDHGRGLGLLSRHWPQVPIYATAATAALLQDRELAQALQLLPWRQPVEVVPNLTLELWPAGHLPGAACALLTYTQGSR
ncbi:MAG: MBL fold metallo-hydrolase, partial [Leptolyngbya sp. SIO3F4]|nr:MBL fold metallo-hydrolase [Leptolyngbya sp. SIO3F4]